jgi:peptide/nickel transport system substrate-binding protein
MMIQRFSLSWPRLNKLGKFFFLFVVCFSLIVACNPNRGDRTPTATNENNSGRITIGTTLKPRTIDPADSYELAGLNIIYNLGDSLYTYELGTTNLKPQLATEMPKVSADGLTYTIPLRQGVTFHDGTPFNAEAMVFSLERFMQNGGKPSFLLADVIDKVEAVGDNEIKIVLKKPFAAFPSLLAFTGACAVSPKSYEIGAGKFNPSQFVGTGPYKLVQFSGDSLKLDVFENYWGEKPANKGIDIQIYSGSSANLFNGFRTGGVDVAYQSLDPEQIKNLLGGASQNKWQSIEANGTAINYLVLNRNQKPLDKVEVRQAIAASINRKLINDRVLQGQGEPAYSLIPNSFDSYKPVFQEVYGDADFSKAKEIIEKAGYSATNPIVVDLWYPSASTTRSLVAQTLKASADKELGGAIQFKVNSVEGATAFSNIPKGIYPAFLGNWYPDFLDPDNYIQPLLYCAKGSAATGCQEGGSQSQGSFYWNDRLNDWIYQQRQERDPEKRKAIFGQIQELIAKDVPYVPLWQNKEYAFAQNGVSGVAMNPSQNIPFWTIKK